MPELVTVPTLLMPPEMVIRPVELDCSVRLPVPVTPAEIVKELAELLLQV